MTEKRRKGLKPRWNRKTRELRLGSALLKRFGRKAPLQELILEAFEEQDWKKRIDDPLPGDVDIRNAHLRLRDTIKRLNHGLRDTALRFHGDGTGEAIRWEIVDGKP